jgi:hypothetical protein
VRRDRLRDPPLTSSGETRLSGFRLNDVSPFQPSALTCPRCQTTGPLVMRLVVVGGLGFVNLYVFFPKNPG